MDIVRTVSTMLRNDPDVAVASAALSTLCTFDALMTPRAPPILIPTRGSPVDGAGTMTKNNGSGGLTASALMQGMNESKTEMMASKEAKGDRKASKKSDKKKKSNKKAKKDTSTETKALPDDQKVHSADSGPGTVKENTAVKESPAANKIDPTPKKSNKNAGDKTNAIASTNGGDADQSQKENSNKRQDDDAMDTSSVEAKDNQDMKEEENTNDEDSDGSLDDFPEIVDEDPDEEDRM